MIPRTTTTELVGLFYSLRAPILNTLVIDCMKILCLWNILNRYSFKIICKIEVNYFKCITWCNMNMWQINKYYTILHCILSGCQLWLRVCSNYTNYQVFGLSRLFCGKLRFNISQYTDCIVMYCFIFYVYNTYIYILGIRTKQHLFVCTALLNNFIFVSTLKFIYTK